MNRIIILVGLAASLLTAACTIRHDEERVVPSGTVIERAR
jgi:hypothetical protein